MARPTSDWEVEYTTTAGDHLPRDLSHSMFCARWTTLDAPSGTHHSTCFVQSIQRSPHADSSLSAAAPVSFGRASKGNLVAVKVASATTTRSAERVLVSQPCIFMPHCNLADSPRPRALTVRAMHPQGLVLSGPACPYSSPTTPNLCGHSPLPKGWAKCIGVETWGPFILQESYDVLDLDSVVRSST